VLSDHSSYYLPFLCLLASIAFLHFAIGHYRKPSYHAILEVMS
jgi:hypothetical protein